MGRSPAIPHLAHGGAAVPLGATNVPDVPKGRSHRADQPLGWADIGRLLALFAAFAAACVGDSSHQVWVVNERADPVVLVLEVVGEDLNPVPDEAPFDFTIPANSEACTYCGTGPMPRARVFVYAAEGCVQLGAAVLVGESAYVITVPPEGLVILEPGRRPDPAGGGHIQPVATACG